MYYYEHTLLHAMLVVAFKVFWTWVFRNIIIRKALILQVAFFPIRGPRDGVAALCFIAPIFALAERCFCKESSTLKFHSFICHKVSFNPFYHLNCYLNDIKYYIIALPSLNMKLCNCNSNNSGLRTTCLLPLLSLCSWYPSYNSFPVHCPLLSFCFLSLEVKT